jgi:hypothetical protein
MKLDDCCTCRHSRDDHQRGTGHCLDLDDDCDGPDNPDSYLDDAGDSEKRKRRRAAIPSESGNDSGRLCTVQESPPSRPAEAPREPGPSTAIEPRWRVGRTLGRTLYRDGVCVGIVDTPEIAAEIVAACNAARTQREKVGASQTPAKPPCDHPDCFVCGGTGSPPPATTEPDEAMRIAKRLVVEVNVCPDADKFAAQIRALEKAAEARVTAAWQADVDRRESAFAKERLGYLRDRDENIAKAEARGEMNGRREALEEAAGLCDGYGREGDRLYKEFACETADELSARIRALAAKPKEGE